MVGSLHCLISIAKVYSSSWAFVLLVLDKCVSSDSVYSSGDLGLYTWLDLTPVFDCVAVGWVAPLVCVAIADDC